ncbi:sensor histidine kinase [Luteimonas huabeiensis]|uniref:sensor histidine kinase n=1 Tax=Luteimonas huabeiensis TaxID=1244513 RepID=UPI000465BBF4|nr:ATP-binding protein [Luteimonas huabeiensis]
MPDTQAPAAAGCDTRWLARAWRAPRRWLAAAPVADPVDRRNAPMMQVVLALLALSPPLLWTYRLLAVPMPLQPGEYAALASGLLLAVLAATGWWLIRRGRFRLPVGLLLGAVALALMLSNASGGMSGGQHELPLLAVWLVMAGLLLGRRALWMLYAWMVLAFAVGTWVDVARGHARFASADLIVGGIVQALIFLFVAVVIDRSVSALRESLQLANERGDALAASNRRLQDEAHRREALQEQLVHAQKVEAVGRLAAGLAHDFNHLLTLVHGHAQRGRRLADDPRVAEAFDGVESATRRAHAVSRKLLAFSRMEDASMTVFDAGEVLASMEPMLRQLFGPQVRLEIEAPAAPVPVHFDRGQLELILLNIAANAAQAMPDGGRFGARLSADAHDARLSLTDTGTGMPPEVQARIFEPFFTTRPAGQGTGLGLAVARDLIAEAGGSIDVDSAPGAGTTLHVRLPLAAA